MAGVYDERPWLALYEEAGEFSPEFADVLGLFRATVREVSDRVALTYFDGTITYRELDRLSDALAVFLSERGFGGGDRLAVYLQNTPQFVIAVLAGWKLGGIVVPLNPMYRSHELSGILADAQPFAIVSSEYGWRDVLADVARTAGVHVAVTTSELDFQKRDDQRLFPGVVRDRAPAATEELPVVDLLDVVTAHEDREPAPATVHPDDIALLTYTSGTSGTPKAATNTHGNVSFNAQSFRFADGSRDGSGILALAPLFHITGMVCQFGAAVAVAGKLDLAYRFEPSVVLDTLREHRPQYMIGPSTAYMALMNQPDVARDDFRSLDFVYSGGAPLPSAVVEDFRARFGHYIRNGYGLTETTATATAVPSHLEAPVDEASGTLSVGLPTYDAVLRVVDDEGADVPVGETGEIVIEGPMVVPAYWNRPDETEAGIRGGRLHTGDVGFMDAQGWFYVVDRKKDMINASGYKVWPREVEDVLYTHPAVREAAVVGVPDPYRGETVKAYVSVARGASVAESSLVEHCKERLAAYKYPREVVLVEELPKTATGKILRRRLRDGAEPVEKGNG